MTSTSATEEAVLEKTRELCQTILNSPDFASIRRRIDAFMADEKAKTQYQQLSEQGEYLEHKQQQGATLTDEEISDFEKKRATFFENANARNFMDARREMNSIQETVTQYVGKTFELGRIPTDDDFESGGSCGSGCGCH